MTLEFVVDENATDRDIAAAFIQCLEGMGARFSWRDGEQQHDWWLELDGIEGLTRPEAETLAREALNHRDAIREVLCNRRWPLGDVVH